MRTTKLGAVLARRGLSPDYFKFDDGSASFADSFYRRAKRAFAEIPLAGNYFLSQYLLGRYQDPGSLPDYLKEEHFHTLRERVDRIQIITSDAKAWLSQRDSASIDVFSLSNICEVMNLEETASTFEQVARTAKPGARACFRNLMIPREVPQSLRHTIRRDADSSRELLAADRSVVYSRVDAYRIEK